MPITEQERLDARRFLLQSRGGSVLQGGEVGFFGSVFNVVKSIGRAVLGIPASIPRATPALLARARAAAPAVARGAAAVGGAALLGGAFQAGSNLVDADGQPIAGGGGGGGGNGLSFRRTLVQTVNRLTGEIEFTQTLRGAPFIMRHDIQIAKRVIRTASKLGRMKGISRTVKQSLTSRTKEAIETKVLAQVTKDIC